MAAPTLLAGELPDADKWADVLVYAGAGNVIGRARRTTSSTASATAQAVLRLDGLALLANHAYLIQSGTLNLVSTVSGDFARALFAADFTGAAATTSSTTLQVAQLFTSGTTNAVSTVLSVIYVPGADQTGSILLYTNRLAGTGNIRLISGSVNPIEFWVTDCGLDPGDAGVDL